MEILAMLACGAVLMGLIWLIVREEPQERLMREYRARQFVETMREAEARDLANVSLAGSRQPAKKSVDARPARSYSSPTPRSTSSSRSSSDDSWVSTSSYSSWGGDSGGSSYSSSCDSSSSSSSSSSCD
jgi:hypothetical protein